MSNNSKSGSDSAETKGSSADDIIEALAQEMGVEDGDEAETAETAATEGESTEADAEVAVEEEADAPVVQAPVPVPAPKIEAKKPDPKDAKKDKKADKFAKADKATPASTSSAHSEEEVEDGDPTHFDNSAAINTVFSGRGEETPVRPVPPDPDIEDAPKSKALMWLGIIVGTGLLAIGAAYASLSAERKECLRLELVEGAGSCQQYHAVLEQERIEAERQARLAAAPKFGSLTIITDPRAFRISAPNQPSYIFPGTRTDMMIPTRARITFENISVTEPLTFTIHGDGNFEDKTVTIPIFSDVTSPWVQNQMTGDYGAERIYSVCWPGAPDAGTENCINPLPARAAELYWRTNWEPPAEPPPGMEVAPGRLFGAITVTSTPAEALIAFNGKQVCDMTTGEPLRTPATFQQYFACDDIAAVYAAQDAAAAATAAGTPPAEAPPTVPRTREVFLSREGLPIQVLLDGKVPTGDAVYRHQFLCNPVPGVATPVATGTEPNIVPPDFLGYCQYSYSVHLDLQDPPPPTEGSGEGSGAAAEGTGAAAEGTGAAAEGTGAAAEGTGN